MMRIVSRRIYPHDLGLPLQSSPVRCDFPSRRASAFVDYLVQAFAGHQAVENLHSRFANHSESL